MSTIVKPARDQQERRRFLGSVVRYGLLGSLGLLAWKLVRQQKSACRSLTTCTDCQLLTHCRLPEAGQARETRA